MIDTTMDNRSISALIRVLKRIMANGGVLDDGSLWNDNPSGDQFESLRELKAHRKSLQKLRRSIEKATISLQSSCNVEHLQSGITNLPVEILSRIFLLSQRPSRDGLDHAMSLSHVCKHFRSVALGALSLWATASLGRPIGQIQTSLERSGSVPLTIFLDQSASHNDVNDDQVVEFLELVIPHAHRWSALHVGKRVQMLSTNHVVRTKYPSLQLPRLIEIVQSPTLFSIDPFVSFLAKWATPKLVSYEFSVVKNVSPQVAILRSPITRCSVSWDKSSNTEINSIVQLLALLPTLEELEMTFIGGVNRIGSVPNQRPINIPSVTSLSLKLKLVDNPDTLLHGLLTLAQLPNVTSLEYLSAQSWTLEGIKHVLFAPNGLPRFEKLEKLDIHDDIMQPKGGIVESVISGYPSLLYLSLHLPTASLYEEGFRWKLNSRTIPEVWISKFSLQTLRLISCDAVTPQEMSFLVCNIRGSPSWDKFLRLDVFDCKHLTEYYYGIWDECLEGKMSWSKWILL